MKKTLARLSRALPETQRNRLARFHDDESGSMIIFTLLIIILMLVIGGMAVDFMRFESRRAMMQGALDSAVLAAADLDQTLDPEVITKDFLTKSQAGNCLNGPVKVENPSDNYRSVTANCQLTMNTFFLRLIGMDQLTANAASTAIEGVGDIEVSLVLDISGSMRWQASDGSGTKIAALRSAASSFVDTLLLPEYEDRISLSIVPYSEHVSVGEELYGTLNTFGRHNWSYCVDVPDSDFQTTTWNNNVQVTQVEHYGRYGLATTTCPYHTTDSILPMSQDVDELKSAINGLEPRGNTAIFLGLKWGTALLDPSFRSNLNSLPNGMIDDVFDDRPVPYPNKSDESNGATVKYLVLMTDGRNTDSERFKPGFYETPSQIAHWNTMSYSTFSNNTLGNGVDYLEPKYDGTNGDRFMDQMCTTAKDAGIIIFGVGLYGENQAANRGPDQMKSCATSSGHYFETTGADLTAIFEAIANQITDLRLTQ